METYSFSDIKRLNAQLMLIKAKPFNREKLRGKKQSNKYNQVSYSLFQDPPTKSNLI